MQRLWLRALPLLVRPPTVLQLLVLWLLELRGPGLGPLWWPVPQPQMLQALASRPQVLGLVVLCALELRLLGPLLLVRHVLGLRRRVLRLLVPQPRMRRAMEL